jgi:hypothetical protein
MLRYDDKLAPVVLFQRVEDGPTEVVNGDKVREERQDILYPEQPAGLSQQRRGAGDGGSGRRGRYTCVPQGVRTGATEQVM